jgi:hypothetical protein
MRERPYSIPGPSEAVSALPSECRVLAAFESALGIQGTVELDQGGHEPRPTGLMTGTQPGTAVTVEIFVKRDVITKVRIGLELLAGTVDWAPAVLVAREGPNQAFGNLPAHLEQVHQLARTGRALDFEVVAVVEIKVHQRPQNQYVHRQPNRAPPVGVATEHAAVGLARQILDAVLLAVHAKDIGITCV